MTNRQWHPDNIDPVEELSYTPLEKSYLKTQAVITALIWLGLMLLPLFLLLADEFDGRNLIVICAEAVLLAAGLVNLSILPKSSRRQLRYPSARYSRSASGRIPSRGCSDSMPWTLSTELRCWRRPSSPD